MNLEKRRKKFNSFKRIYNLFGKKGFLSNLAFLKMIEYEDDFEDCEKLYLLLKEGSKQRQKVVSRMLELAEIFYECRKVCLFFKPKEGFEEVPSKLLNLATIFDNWKDIYDLSKKGSELEALALSKMLELEESFNDWVFVCPEEENNLQILAFSRMEALAKSSSNWMFAFEVFQNKTKPKAFAFSSV